MKTNYRCYLGVEFNSNEIDLMQLRISDLFYIAFISIASNGEGVPTNKEIANLLYKHGLKNVTIKREQNNHYQLYAYLY